MSVIKRAMEEYEESDRIAERQKRVVDEAWNKIRTRIECGQPAATEDLTELQAAKERLADLRVNSANKLMNVTKSLLGDG